MCGGGGDVSAHLHHDDVANDALADGSPVPEADLRRFHLAHLTLRMHGDDLCRGLAALKHADLAPRETVQTLKEDAQWAKDQMS